MGKRILPIQLAGNPLTWRVWIQWILKDFYCYFAQEGLRTGMGVWWYPPWLEGAYRANKRQ
jgi:hypothetical protein